MLFRTLALFIFFTLTCIGSTAKKGNLTVDLDGKGNEQKANWTAKIDEQVGKADFILNTTNQQWSYQGKGWDVEVETARPWGSSGREIILVRFLAESDFQQIILVGLAGGKLRELDRIEVLGDIRFPGNRSAIVTDWMGFWRRTQKYTVHQDGKLTLVPQPFHFVGVEAKANSSFAIYQDRSKKVPLATIGAGSTISVVLCSPTPDPKPEEGDDIMNDWFLIKSVTGYLGWVQLKDVTEKLTLPWAG